MLKIYGFPTFNVTKVLITAEELNLPYEFCLINLAQGEQQSPNHLGRHPAGKVPVLEDDGQFLYESATICRYLARRQNSTLYPSDPWPAAKVDQEVDFATHHIGRWLAVYFFEEYIKPKFLDETRDGEAVAEAEGWLRKFFPVVDQRLNENEFLAGPDITIADTIAWSYINSIELTTASIDGFGHLNRWYDAIKERPSIGRAMGNYPAM
ncbi:MAG: glutathione S-transferase family protein [Pseudomonadota bacterium]